MNPPTTIATGKTGRIDIPRLLLGGVVAGIVLNLITGIANAGILRGGFETWANAMGSHLHPPAQPIQICLWVLMCLVDGMVGVLLYAAMRPRFGARIGTALLAGLLVWVVGRLCVAMDMTALGVFPWQLMFGQTVLGLIAIVPGVFVGSWIYRES